MEPDKVSKNLDYFHKLNETGEASIGISHTITALNVMFLAEFHKIFAERWPTFIIYHNIARFPTWYNPSVFPEYMKPDIVKPLQNADVGNSLRKELDGIIKFVLTPREETVRPYGNLPTDTVENFREAFPELWEIVKFDFLYNKEFTKAKLNPSTYGSLEKGKVI